MTSVARTTNNQCSILKEYCDDVISHNGKYYYEQNKTAKDILQISNTTFDSKLKYVPTDHRILRDQKTYVSQDVVIKNLTETNQLFVIPLLEKLNFITRKTVFDTRRLGTNIPFSRIITHDMMKTINDSGNHIKGLRDELLFLDSIVHTLRHQGLDWPGNLDFQCTKVVDGYRYDLYIKCSKICIEYNEYKSHHTCDVGISHDDEKKRITNSEGYLLLNFDQTKKGDDSKQSTLTFISEILPIIRTRRHLHDFDTPDNEIYLDYLEYNGINKNHAKLMQEIALHKDDFTLTIENAMLLMRMDTKEEKDIETVLNLIKKFNNDIWKCEIDGKLNNIFSNLTIYNGRLNHRGFVKVAVLVNTDFSHEILDYYMKVDEICSILFNDIRKEQKESAKKMENNHNSYKYKLENQQMLENKIIDAIKYSKDIEIENKEILIQSKNEELKLLKPLFRTVKSLTENQVSTLPSKLKHEVGQLRTNTLFKTKYEDIEDGDILFEDLPNLVYSKYSDDCVTFKKIKDIWNAKILTKKKNLNTYKELKTKFTILKDFPNINIKIEELETNSAHNIDNNRITNVRLEDMNIEHIEYIDSDEELEDSEEDSELDLLDESDDESESESDNSSSD
jgi:hypothetical protein